MRGATAILAAALCGCLMGGGDGGRARGSVVENEIAGMLFAEGGPAAGARVRLFRADTGASQGEAVAVATVGTDGAYRFGSVADGEYAVLGDQGGTLSFRDKVGVRSEGGSGRLVQLGADTLLAPGTIEVKVELKPGDDAATVRGEVVGTDFHAQAADDGDVSMNGMPAGRLRIRFTTSLPDYEPLLVEVEVAPGKTTSAGTLNLPY